MTAKTPRTRTAGRPKIESASACLLAWVQNTSTDPIAAAYLVSVLDKNAIGYDAAIAHLLAHKRAFQCPTLSGLIRELSKRMRRDKTEHSQTRHVRATLVAFYRALPRDKREHPDRITGEDIETFLSRWNSDSPKTWNESRAHLVSVFRLAVRRGWLVVSPLAQIDRRPPLKHRPPPVVLEPMAALELMRWLQKNAPEWVLYFAFCLFAGLRPDIREGEAHRLDKDMRSEGGRLRRAALDGDGFWIRGKDGNVRHVAWSLCGPLHAWANAYPQKGLIPDGLSYSQAERRLQAIRERFELGYDVLRHTGASAMLHTPGASFAQVALALGNSERMLTRHYVGVWNSGKTASLYALLPASGPSLTIAAVA